MQKSLKRSGRVNEGRQFVGASSGWQPKPWMKAAAESFDFDAETCETRFLSRQLLSYHFCGFRSIVYRCSESSMWLTICVMSLLGAPPETAADQLKPIEKQRREVLERIVNKDKIPNKAERMPLSNELKFLNEQREKL